MYAEYFGLSSEPFPVTPDGASLYLGDTHKDALAALFYGVEHRRGFVQIVGEVGTGKTTILRAFLNALDRAAYTTIVVLDPNMKFGELLAYMLQEFDSAAPQLEGYALVSRVHGRLIDEYRAGRNVVLVVDEAQNMPVRTLEQLRMLSNIETDNEKIIQIVLAGQPELDVLLARPELRQVRQRIGVRAVIEPLSERAAHEYLAQHIRDSGGAVEHVFTRGARDEIAKYARGVPRALNIAADTTLIHALGAQVRPATRTLAREAIRSLGTPLFRRRSGGRAAAAFAVMAIGAATLGWYYAASDPDTTPRVADVLPAAAVAASAPTQRPAAIAAPLVMARTIGMAPVESVTARNETRPKPETAEVIALPAPPEAYSVIGPQRARIKWDRGPLPDELYPLQHTVRSGDLISQLCFDVYGFAADELYELVLAANPALTSVDGLEPGQVVLFPPLTPRLQVVRAAHIDYKIRRARSSE